MNIFFNSRINANQSLLNVLFGQQQKADTDEEDDYFEQYLSRIGIDSWEGIIQDIP